MSRWPVRRLVALYPRAWRERYGVEVGDLTDELISGGQTTRLRAGLELVEGAAIEHGRASPDPRRPRWLAWRPSPPGPGSGWPWPGRRRSGAAVL